MSEPLALQLRPARKSEAGVLAHMSRRLVEHGLPWRYTPPRIANLLRDPETASVVGEDALGVQGFALMHFGDENAHLVLLAVQRAWQRRGVGSRLLDWQLETARVAGIRKVVLELRADNEIAFRFYRRRGFGVIGRNQDYYDAGVDALRMQLSLRD